MEFNDDDTTSVFQLLEKACRHMCRFSLENMSKKLKSNASQFHQKFAYTCFMWGEFVLNVFHSSIWDKSISKLVQEAL